MAFKKYPQPPFKRFVKLSAGKILELDWRTPEPAVYSKRGKPLPRFGWQVSYDGYIYEEGSLTGIITFCDVIVATADTKEELDTHCQKS